MNRYLFRQYHPGLNYERFRLKSPSEQFMRVLGNAQYQIHTINDSEQMFTIVHTSARLEYEGNHCSSEVCNLFMLARSIAHPVKRLMLTQQFLFLMLIRGELTA